MQNNLDVEEKKNHLCLASMRQCCTRLPKVNGMNILHALCHFPSSCPGVLDTVDQLLHKCPEATQFIDSDGRTALHHIFAFNSKRDARVVERLVEYCNENILHIALRSKSCSLDVIKDIALAKIDSLSAVDEDTGLVPFMFAGLVQNLSVVYNLLLLKPDILKNYI